MSRITRKTLQIFCGQAVATEIGQFGSKEAGIPVTSNDPVVIQALAAWGDGWSPAIITANKAPYKQDMNGVMYVHSYMTAYLFQEGIPEWDAGTTYFKGSIVKRAGTFEQYGSLVDNNTGNAVPVQASNANWQWLNPPSPNTPVFGNSIKDNLVVKNDSINPNTNVDVSANALSVQGVSVGGISVSANITLSGAGGLDTGSPANNTWYAIHVITNSSGTLTALLLSLSGTAPTLPSGYTAFRRVGWVRRNGSGNFVQFQKIGDFTYFTDAAAVTVANPSGVTSFSTSVPPAITLGIFSLDSIGGGSGPFRAKIAGSAMADVVYSRVNATVGAAVAQIPLRASDQAMDITANASDYSVTTTGYYDPV